MNRSGQSWSIDIVTAIVIFGFVAVAISTFALFSPPDAEQLGTQAEKVSDSFRQSQSGCDPVITENDVIDPVALDCVFTKDKTAYDQLKRELGVRGDFCLYLEDENGQIIAVNGENGWGDSELAVGGRQCKTA